MNLRDITRRFTYHPIENTAAGATRAAKHEEIRSACDDLARRIAVLCPESRELSLALTRIEEAQFWANAAIAREHETD